MARDVADIRYPVLDPGQIDVLALKLTLDECRSVISPGARHAELLHVPVARGKSSQSLHRIARVLVQELGDIRGSCIGILGRVEGVRYIQLALGLARQLKQAGGIRQPDPVFIDLLVDRVGGSRFEVALALRHR